MENREIKFRAWLLEEKTFIYDDSDHDYQLLYQGGVFLIVYNNSYEQEWYDKGFFINQFTGLQDKNGNDIYEGDICRISEYYFGDSLIRGHDSIVKYANGAYFLDYEFSPELCSESIYNHNIFIIGNMYENPELLKYSCNKKEISKLQFKVNGEKISHCYHKCPYFALDGGPGPIMYCSHPQLKKEGKVSYEDVCIISHPECKTGFPEKCPLRRLPDAIFFDDE